MALLFIIDAVMKQHDRLSYAITVGSTYS